VIRPDQLDVDEIDSLAKYGRVSTRTIKAGQSISELIASQCGAAAGLIPVHPFMLRSLKASNPNDPVIRDIDLGNLDSAYEKLTAAAVTPRELLVPACARFADPARPVNLTNGVQSIAKNLSIPFDVALFAEIVDNSKRREALRSSAIGSSPLKEELSRCRQRLGNEDKWTGQLGAYFACLNALDAIVNKDNKIQGTTGISGGFTVRAPTNASGSPKTSVFVRLDESASKSLSDTEPWVQKYQAPDGGPAFTSGFTFVSEVNPASISDAACKDVNDGKPDIWPFDVRLLIRSLTDGFGLATSGGGGRTSIPINTAPILIVDSGYDFTTDNQPVDNLSPIVKMALPTAYLTSLSSQLPSMAGNGTGGRAAWQGVNLSGQAVIGGPIHSS
jgi:hypothetical protein